MNGPRMRNGIAVCLALAVLALGQTGWAATKTWAPGTTDFNLTTNWTGGLPGTADIATFTGPAGTQPNVTANISVSGVNFSSSTSDGYDLTSSSTSIALTLLSTATGATGAINSANTTLTNTIDAPIILGAAGGSTQTFTQASGGTLTLNGVISSTNSITLSLASTGTIKINGANTYTGTTQWAAGGTTIIGNSAAFGSSTINFNQNNTIKAGVDLTGANKITNAITFAATTFFKNDLGFNLEFSGNVNLGGTARTIDENTGTITFGGIISNDGGGGLSLITSNGGIFVLSGANTYTGNTTIRGTVSVSSIGASGAVGNLGAGTTINLGGGGADLGILLYTGAGETTSKVIHLNAGTPTIDTTGATGPLTLSADFTSANGPKTLTLTGDSTGNTISGKIVDNINAISLLKLGTGTWILSGANTYTGTTTVGSANGANAGTLQLSGSGLISNAATTVFGGTLDLNGTTQTITTLTLGNGASGSAATVSIGAGELKLGGNLTFTATNDPNGATISGSGGGKLSLNGTRTFQVQDSAAAANDLTVSAIIQDGNTSSGITKTSTGTLVLSGANTYTGKTSIQNGTLIVSSLNSVVGGSANSNLGAPTTVANGTIDLTAGTGVGQLTYTGTGETTDRVINLAAGAIGGTIDQSGTGLLKFTSDLTATGVGSKTLTLQGSTSGTGEISGAIVDNAGNNRTSVTKSGTGTWTLSGANTFTGTTTINGGTLTLDYSTNNTTKLSDTFELDLGGGTLNLSGGSHTEVVAKTVLNSGASSVTRTSGTAVLRMNVITRNAGSTINFGAGSIADTDTINLGGHGILGGYATVGAVTGSADWAKSVDVFSANSAITAFTTYNSFATSGSDNNNPLLTGSSTLTGNLTTNSLKIDSSGAGQSLNIVNGQTMTLNTGGLMFVGANDYQINNGTLKSATATNSDLIIQQWGAGNLTINSVIANGTGASTLTKAGIGTLTLSGDNTYTGATTISGGTLAIGAAGTNSPGSINTTTSITVHNGGTLLLNGAGDGAATSRVKDTAGIGLSGGIIKTSGASEFTGGTFAAPTGAGLGALTLNAANSALDFSGTKGLLAFGGFNDASNFVLTLNNYFGQGGASGTDRLIFAFANQAAADAALPDFAFSYNNTTVAAIDVSLGGGLWEIDPVMPIPEPSTWIGGALALAAIGYTQRRRLRSLIPRIALVEVYDLDQTVDSKLANISTRGAL